jgi:hypothetical protein
MVSYVTLIMSIKSQIKNDLLHGVIKVKLDLCLYNFLILNRSHPSQYCIASNHNSCSTFIDNQVKRKEKNSMSTHVIFWKDQNVNTPIL